MADYLRFVKRFKNCRVLIIGDVMLDEYIWGRVERISPEAPVQVVEVGRVSHIPGGAANVANNVASLSGKAWIMGVAGRDPEQQILIKGMKDMHVEPVLFEEDRPTVRKVRVMGQNQQLLRIDYEKRSHIDERTEDRIVAKTADMMKELDCVVVSDYAKGVVTRSLMARLTELCNGGKIPLIVDPKPRNMKYFKGADLVTPNHREASAYAQIEEECQEDLVKIGRRMVRQLEANCLITRGEKGMSLFEKNGTITHIATKARSVYDVTGAGDTVIAVVALARGAGASWADGAAIANYAAGVVVGKLGTATLSPEELKTAMERDSLKGN